MRSHKKQRRMRTPGNATKGTEKILCALAEFDYLTAAQVTRLCYAKGSLTYVKATLKSLVDAGLAVSLGGRGTSLPRVYTPTGTGYTVASVAQGLSQTKRVSRTEEATKAGNVYFLQHTIAVTDILIAAKILSHTIPDITLKRMYLERELKRKIYLELPVVIGNGKTERRTICLEPDAAVDFVIKNKCRSSFILKCIAHIFGNTASNKKFTPMQRMRRPPFIKSFSIPRRLPLLCFVHLPT
jgi:hypothetical protein